ncbi:MAG: PIN domain-containing protein [Spirochaetales bacterium]|nr:PIN domain-containing protein [Spirochaetales bacterium]
MIKIFVDSDIILDLLLKRKEFDASARLMSSLVNLQYKAYTTPIVIANIHYIMTKLESESKSIDNIKKLRKFISILPVNEEIIDLALDLSAVDFEDSIQFITSEKNDLDFIITRNKKDYKESKIPALTAAEFLNLNINT